MSPLSNLVSPFVRVAAFSCCVLGLGVAHAGVSTAPVALVGGVSGVAQSAAGGGGFAGHILLGRGWVVADVGVREQLVGPDWTLVGSVLAGARFRHDSGLYGRVGFAHAHDAGMGQVADDPVGTVGGTSEDITHRSGGELGVGVLRPLPPRLFGERLSELFAVGADLGVTVLPSDALPWVRTYGGVQLALMLGGG